MSIIKVGIIGFGVSGKLIHTALLKVHTGYRIEMVSSSRTEELKAILPDVKTTTDPYELINQKNLDLIINCAPNSFHYSLTAAALKAGKNVVVEKPFVNTVADGRHLTSLAQSAKKSLSVFHNRRWDSDFLTVKKVIEAGTLGKIKQFESHFDRWRPTNRVERWREQPLIGSGSFYDLGSHLIDQALNLFGLPDQLMADICNQKKGAVNNDYFHIILKYEEMRVILHSSSFTDTTPRFQVFGDQGSFTKYGFDPQESQLKQGTSPLDPNFGREEEKYFGKLVYQNEKKTDILVSEKGNYLEFYDDLYNKIISGKGDVPVSAAEALQVIEVIELAHQSSKSGVSILL